MNKDLIKNIVYGFAIGDALGVPFEFQSSEYCKKYYKGKYVTGTHNQLPGTWSDDTSILLCVLDSRGYIDQYKQNLIDWYNNNSKFSCFDRFDAGMGTTKAIKSNFKDTKNNKGNACLSVTLGCWLLGMSTEDIIKFVSVTHNNKESFEASKKYRGTLKGIIVDYVGEEIDNKGFCLDSLHIAIKCAYSSDNFKDVVKKAIEFGVDTDSHAAFSSAIYISNNYNSLTYKLPKYYLDNLRGIDKINNILKSL